MFGRGLVTLLVTTFTARRYGRAIPSKRRVHWREPCELLEPNINSMESYRISVTDVDGSSGPQNIGKTDRAGMVFWFTGLSGAGKSTLAQRLASSFSAADLAVEVLDGDLIRGILSPDLGYSRQDRDLNIRRIGFLSYLLSRNGVIVIVAAISPYRETRVEIRKHHAGVPFIEIFVDCALEVLIARDAKGLYQKAIRGEIQNFTGISDPYEAPENPEITVHTDCQTPEESVACILAALRQMNLFRS
jgi:adenylylsulfate kinase